jgi:ferrous iron transport protein B
VVEMPNYKLPLFKNVAINVIEKTKSFVFGAGKIILAISIILWYLGSHSSNPSFKNAEKIVAEKAKAEGKVLEKSELENITSTYKLENSYIGKIGKTIEPAIRPLGYDWKIGIAVVTSFAAREVFVGTLATIYSVGNNNDDSTIKSKMQADVRADGTKIFNFATGVSLLLFYAFAMQCASTLAITKKETNTWKWPIIQLVFMSGFAYITALIAYQFLK